MEDQTAEIAGKIQAGDEKAFEKAFRQYYAPLSGYARQYMEDLEEAEEAVQEVFFNYWNKKESICITGSLEAYLYRSVRNNCLNKLKHQKIKGKYALLREADIKEEEKKQTDPVEALELQQQIDRCIEKMPPERKKIFLMSRSEEMKYREIADQLGLSVKTVEAQMGKALRFLRESLSDYLPILLLLTCWAVKLLLK